MTIDERLEALTQTVELSAGMQRASARLAAAIEEDGKHVRGLVRIAEIHEHRLTDLQGGQ